jgi:hypothetical protein
MLSKLRHPRKASVANTNGTRDSVDMVKENGVGHDEEKLRFITPRVIVMGVIVSIGGMIFGYDTVCDSAVKEMISVIDF